MPTLFTEHYMIEITMLHMLATFTKSQCAPPDPKNRLPVIKHYPSSFDVCLSPVCSPTPQQLHVPGPSPPHNGPPVPVTTETGPQFGVCDLR